MDVLPKLSARVRLMDPGRVDDTDPNDASTAAVVAVRNSGLTTVSGEDQHRVILRLLADRYGRPADPVPRFLLPRRRVGAVAGGQAL